MTRLRLLLLVPVVALVTACASDPPPPLPGGRSVHNNTAPWLEGRRPKTRPTAPTARDVASKAPLRRGTTSKGSKGSKGGMRHAPSLKEMESGETADRTGDAAQHAATAYVVKLQGMTCPIRCPKEVRQQLEAVPGVVSASVDYPSKTASVQTKKGVTAATVLGGLHPPYSGTLIGN